MNEQLEIKINEYYYLSILFSENNRFAFYFLSGLIAS